MCRGIGRRALARVQRSYLIRSDLEYTHKKESIQCGCSLCVLLLGIGLVACFESSKLLFEFWNSVNAAVFFIELGEFDCFL